MKINTINEGTQVTTLRSGQKRSYKTPLLRVYGAVRQFTQGTKNAGSDANSTLTKNTASDRAFKTNLAQVGMHPLGIGLYLFDYKPEFQEAHGFGRQFGVMADEVEGLMPDAVVTHVDGFKRVNYAMLGINTSQRCVH